jgi:hypothetical protein
VDVIFTLMPAEHPDVGQPRRPMTEYTLSATHVLKSSTETSSGPYGSLVRQMERSHASPAKLVKQVNNSTLISAAKCEGMCPADPNYLASPEKVVRSIKLLLPTVYKVGAIDLSTRMIKKDKIGQAGAVIQASDY